MHINRWPPSVSGSVRLKHSAMTRPTFKPTLKAHWYRSLSKGQGLHSNTLSDIDTENMPPDGKVVRIVIAPPVRLLNKLKEKHSRRMFPPTTGPRAAPSTGLTIQCGSDKGCPPVPDHSLSLDFNSPSNLNLYEGEFGDCKLSLLSPCSSSVGEVSSPLADSAAFPPFDLNPQMEQSGNLDFLLGESYRESQDLQEIDCLKPSITELEFDSNNSLFNMDDVLLDKKDTLKGPTLAALNSQMPDFDDMRWASTLSRPPLAPRNSTVTTTSLPAPTCTPQNQILAQSNRPELTTVVSEAAPAVQYVTFNGGKVLSQPFPAGPPIVPTSAQIIATNPCINQLLIPVKTEPIEAQPQVAAALAAVKEEMRGIKRSLSPDNDSNSSFESKWKDIKEILTDKVEVLSPKKIKQEPVDFAFTPHEEPASQAVAEDEFDSGADDDHSDRDSDNDDLSDIEPSSSFIEEFISSGRKEKRFFWQYNLQSKGPKGKRLAKRVENDDPHVLHDFEDPVFDPDQQDMKYKHNGKARRGDGNDITPSPYRLFQIGNELSKLNHHINSISPADEMPQGTRNRKRKEKNKFASRACRLKKKAQHEANKLKLYGLDQEHSQLMKVLVPIRQQVKARKDSTEKNLEPLVPQLEKLIHTHLTCGMVAGNTADYVNSVLEKVAHGDKTGGINLND